jgi:hypothetical protein
MGANVRIRGLKQGKKFIHNTVRNTAIETMKDNMKDLERVASETAPLDEGDLEMSGFHDVDEAGAKITGWVGFEVFNEDFNYAIWTHEEDYNLGERSQQKAGGSGMSGTSYPVGNKYLTRPLEGEAPYYRDQLEKEIKDSLK